MLQGVQPELLAYLQGPGFGRLWPKVKAKLEQLDRIGGRVTLSGLDGAERAALEGLLAVNLYGRTSVIVDLKRLDEALTRSRFEASLEDCMNVLFPDAFVSRRRVREAEQADWHAFCDWTLSLVADARIADWLRTLHEGSGIGYRTFCECFEQFQQLRESPAWRNSSRALETVLARNASERVRLPVFAAMTTGDAHGLDRNTLTGRMFFWALVALDSVSDLEDEDSVLALDTLDGEAVRSVYLRFGILLDDISSIVWVAGFPDVAESPVALTLWTVDGLILRANSGRVFVVENPSIFGTLIDAAGTRSLPYPLICPSGQPSIAALRLLDHVTAAGATIFYSGDFDVAGLQIAASLAERYGERFVPWRMRARDYLGVQHDGLPCLSETDVRRLSGTRLPWENTDAAEDGLLMVMSGRGVKVFQEHLVKELCRDYWG